MEELDEGRYSVMPSSPELAVEIAGGSFAWDPLTTADRTGEIVRLRAVACRRKSAVAGRSKVKRSRLEDEDDDDDDDDDVRPDPVSLLIEAMTSRDDAPDVLFDINFTVAKVGVIMLA